MTGADAASEQPADTVELAQLSAEPRQHTFVKIGDVDETTQTILQVRYPLTLTWENVLYRVTVVGGKPFKRTYEDRLVLDNVTGAARPGRLLAIMGPSGSGKTSLLNAISNRVKPTSGTLLLNHQPLPSHFNKISSYVMQDDVLFETLTPRELLNFAASTRLPRDMTKEARKKRVESLIQRLSLTHCADTRVGKPLVRGLSGGERKRAAIAYEMITNPSLLFLDEPTSGLDSFTSLNLVELLKDLAAEGRTIVTTIHQPSSDIFVLFDDLLLMSGGRVAYQGLASLAPDYFAKLDLACPPFTNPTDHFMKILHSHSEEDRARTRRITDYYLENTKPEDVLPPAPAQLTPVPKPPKGASVLSELMVLTKRAGQNYMRDPTSFHARFGQTIFIALLVGILYFQVVDTQAGVQDRTGALFFIINNQVMASVMTAVLTFPLERVVLVREQYSGMYRIGTYFWGRFLVDVPFMFLFPAIFSCIAYFMVGLQESASHFFIFFLTIWLVNNVSTSMGVLLGTAFPNGETAVALAPVVIMPFMLFGGFYVNLETAPKWISWIQYISVFKWGFEPLVINEFLGLKLTCLDSELIHAGPISICPITEGERVLQNLAMSATVEGLWRGIWVMAILFVGFRMFAWLLLEWQTRRTMRRG